MLYCHYRSSMTKCKVSHHALGITIIKAIHNQYENVFKCHGVWNASLRSLMVHGYQQFVSLLVLTLWGAYFLPDAGSLNKCEDVYHYFLVSSEVVWAGDVLQGEQRATDDLSSCPVVLCGTFLSEAELAANQTLTQSISTGSVMANLKHCNIIGFFSSLECETGIEKDSETKRERKRACVTTIVLKRQWFPLSVAFEASQHHLPTEGSLVSTTAQQ